MSRAKDYLEISYHNISEGWNSFSIPSRFIQEIPKDLLDFKDLRKIKMSSGKEVVSKRKNRFQESSKTSDCWYVGQTIRHPKYGEGTISKMTEKNMVCHFEKFGDRSFSRKFLPILPID